MLIERTCQYKRCGKTFLIHRHILKKRKGNGRFCSNKCNGKDQNERYLRTYVCKNESCKKKFSSSRKKPREYCSPMCYLKNRKRRHGRASGNPIKRSAYVLAMRELGTEGKRASLESQNGKDLLKSMQVYFIARRILWPTETNHKKSNLSIMKLLHQLFE